MDQRAGANAMIYLAIIAQILAVTFFLAWRQEWSGYAGEDELPIGSEYSYIIDIHDGDPYVATAKVLQVKDGYVQYKAIPWIPNASESKVAVQQIERFKRYATPVKVEPNPFALSPVPPITP